MEKRAAAAVREAVSSIACRRSALPGPSAIPGPRTIRKRNPSVMLANWLMAGTGCGGGLLTAGYGKFPRAYSTYVRGAAPFRAPIATPEVLTAAACKTTHAVDHSFWRKFLMRSK